MYSEKFLENSIKLLRNPLPVILQTFFPQSQRTLKKDTWTLKGHSSETQRSLEHSKGTPKALGRAQSTWVLWHLGTQSTWAFGHSGTMALEGHLGTRGTRDTLFCRLLRKDITFPFYVLNLISQKPRNFLHV